jgi:hypothetical protein
MSDSIPVSMLSIMVVFTIIRYQWIDEDVVGEILQEFEPVLRMNISGYQL